MLEQTNSDPATVAAIPARYTVEWRPGRPDEYLLRTSDGSPEVAFQSWGEALLYAATLKAANAQDKPQ